MRQTAQSPAGPAPCPALRRHMSLLVLFTRASLLPLLGVLAFTGAVQAGLFWAALRRALALDPAQAAGQNSLLWLLEHSQLHWPAWAALLLTAAFLCLSTGCSFGSHPLYTLRRLWVGERTVFLWQAGYNALCFLALWAAQAGVMLGLCALYAHMAPDWVNGQSVYLAFWRSPYLHALLPLEDWAVWLRNALLCPLLGLICAYFPYRQRRGGRFSPAYPLPFLLAGYLFPAGWERNGLLWAPFLCLLAACWCCRYVYAQGEEVIP